MKLGSYEFVRNPSIYGSPKLMTPIKRIATVDTYNSVAVFSWGVSVVGKKIDLNWEYLPESQYQELLTLYMADAPTVFDPNDGSGKTYNVELLALDGRYHYKLQGSPGEDVWRSKVTLELLVLSEVV